jgi:hypothetical protein
MGSVIGMGISRNHVVVVAIELPASCCGTQGLFVQSLACLKFHLARVSRDRHILCGGINRSECCGANLLGFGDGLLWCISRTGIDTDFTTHCVIPTIRTYLQGVVGATGGEAARYRKMRVITILEGI